VITAVFAGSDTAASCMGQLIHVLLSDNRRRWEELLADASQLDLYVEEGLRICNPVRGTLRRVVNDIEIDGIQLKAGQTVRTHTAAASRDESVFPEPDSYDPSRANVRQHITFGRGPHVCPGSNLAKKEIRTAIETLLTRLPSMRLVPGHGPKFSISQFVPELEGGIVVEWDERSAGA
jgi:cytochrome P450